MSDPEKSFKLFAEKSHKLTALYKQIMSENNLNVDKQLLEDVGLKSKKHVRLFSAKILYKLVNLQKRQHKLYLKILILILEKLDLTGC